MTDAVIYETGTEPEPKQRFIIEILTTRGTWREIDDQRLEQVATLFAETYARQYSTKARVIDTHALAEDDATSTGKGGAE